MVVLICSRVVVVLICGGVDLLRQWLAMAVVFLVCQFFYFMNSFMTVMDMCGGDLCGGRL